jgi:predicted DNA-binding helix-hairpin-helix protein
VVGAVGESDLDLLYTTNQLRVSYRIARAYFSGFSPVINTPFENLPPLNTWRKHRLYQAFYLLRDYQFSVEDIQFNPMGNLDIEKDPKLVWAEANLYHQPVEINTASYQQLIKIPGVGAITAKNILKTRAHHKLRDLQTLQKLGASVKRAARFILLDGHHPTFQLELFK